jgi:hypothetical protein
MMMINGFVFASVFALFASFVPWTVANQPSRKAEGAQKKVHGFLGSRKQSNHRQPAGFNLAGLRTFLGLIKGQEGACGGIPNDVSSLR